MEKQERMKSVVVLAMISLGSDLLLVFSWTNEGRGISDHLSLLRQ